MKGEREEKEEVGGRKEGKRERRRGEIFFIKLRLGNFFNDVGHSLNLVLTVTMLISEKEKKGEGG